MPSGSKPLSDPMIVDLNLCQHMESLGHNELTDKLKDVLKWNMKSANSFSGRVATNLGPTDNIFADHNAT